MRYVHLTSEKKAVPTGNVPFRIAFIICSAPHPISALASEIEMYSSGSFFLAIDYLLLSLSDYWDYEFDIIWIYHQ